MSEDAPNAAIPCTITRLFPMQDGGAVVLHAAEKHFVILVGLNEAQAMYREMHACPTERPMTHDALMSALEGFEITVHKVVISALLKGIFCGTVILRQKKEDGMCQEVRMDARASDSLVIALKAKAPIFVAAAVLKEAPDASDSLREIDSLPPEAEGEPPAE
ncbi:MAG TPA: bifunctional nuclease family protein [Planctomycetota bacterium]|jgi:bifunctional DNase/RNase|nr:bifunctional nuclease family protein [Planctomycetota bacterium]